MSFLRQLLERVSPDNLGIRRTRLILWLLTIVATMVSLYVGYQIRFEFHPSADWVLHGWNATLWIIPLEWVVFYAWGLFEPLAARYRWRDFTRVGSAVAVITAFLFYMWYIFGGGEVPPRSVIAINGLLLVIFLSAIGSVSFQLRNILTGRFSAVPSRASRVLVVGTGFLSKQLIEQTRENRGLGLRVVGLLDPADEYVPGSFCLGVPVAGRFNSLEQVCHRFDPDRIIITDPMLPPEKLQSLLEQCRRQRVPVFIVPTAQEMFYGVLRVEAIRPVGLEDTLGRGSLEIDLPGIMHLLSGRCVMVTGAGGSIGSELCRQILAYGPSRLLVLDVSEVALFQIEQELRALPLGSRISPILVNVRDTEQVRAVLERERPAILFHAAALKHVPMMERFPAEALRTNTLATARLAEVAEACGVERMVFVSTDKAINPTNVMGASKRLAELWLQSRSRRGGGMPVVAVRFGNVIASSGSVVPIFERQISAGGPVTVTHPDVQRYFMSIPEAVGLVLQSATQGHGGEIFMLDMGEPLKVIDVARAMIELRGLTPERDIKIKIIGLRPGEKLFEELRYDREIHEHTAHPSVYQLTAPALTPDEADALLSAVERLGRERDPAEIRRGLCELLPEYQPSVNAADAPREG